MGVGALKCMSAREGEIKSMHTLKTARRSGVGSALLSHIMGEAKGMGLSRLLLETGSFDFFVPRGHSMRAMALRNARRSKATSRTPTAPSWRGISDHDYCVVLPTVNPPADLSAGGRTSAPPVPHHNWRSCRRGRRRLRRWILCPAHRTQPLPRPRGCSATPLV